MKITQEISYTNDTLDCGFNSTWSYDNQSVKANITWFWDNGSSSGFASVITDDETEIALTNNTFANTTAIGDLEPADTVRDYIFGCQVTTYDNLSLTAVLNSSNLTIQNSAPIINEEDLNFGNTTANHSMIIWANFSDSDNPSDMGNCKFFITNRTATTTKNSTVSTGNCTILLDFDNDNFVVNEELNVTIQVDDGTAYTNSTPGNNTMDDPLPPLWQNQSQSRLNPVYEDSVMLIAQAKDLGKLGFAILSTNESGSYNNHTSLYGSPVNMGGLVNIYNWSNFTWANLSIATGTIVGWRIWYNDTSGNYNKTNTLNFTINAKSTGGVGGWSGGGGNPKSATSLDKTEMMGVTIMMSEGNNLFFKVKQKQHTIKIDKVDSVSETVTLTINSFPITITLKVGETKLVDTDRDSYNDLSITLKGIEDGEAILILKEIEEIEEIKEKEQAIEEIPKEVEEKIIPDNILPLPAQEIVDSMKFKKLLLILLLIVIPISVYSIIKLKNPKIKLKNIFKKVFLIISLISVHIFIFSVKKFRNIKSKLKTKLKKMR